MLRGMMRWVLATHYVKVIFHDVLIYKKNIPITPISKFPIINISVIFYLY